MRRQIQFNRESTKDNILCEKNSTINIKGTEWQVRNYTQSHVCGKQLNR